jgi:hypothetical protein
MTDTFTDTSLVARDRLHTLTEIRELLGEQATADQTQAMTEFVLTGRIPIDPAGLDRAAEALARAAHRDWGHHDVCNEYRGKAFAAITAYLAPAN